MEYRLIALLKTVILVGAISLFFFLINREAIGAAELMQVLLFYLIYEKFHDQMKINSFFDRVTGAERD